MLSYQAPTGYARAADFPRSMNSDGTPKCLPPGSPGEPGDEFDIRVVVPLGVTEKEVQDRYPTIRGRSDYRIVSRDVAILYLDRKITELRNSPVGPKEYDFGPLRLKLQDTRSIILGCLPDVHIR